MLDAHGDVDRLSSQLHVTRAGGRLIAADVVLISVPERTEFSLPPTTNISVLQNHADVPLANGDLDDGIPVPRRIGVGEAPGP
jgi:hypothetical protein